jgi:predicted PurR-regulated permease PerM
MNASQNSLNDKLFVTRALDATIHIGLVILLLFYCFQIGRPFIDTIVWGIIIAVAVYPGHQRLQSMLGGRGGLAAALIVLLALVLLIVPTFMLGGSLVETAREYSVELRDGALNVPPPPENIRSWPAIGEPLYKFWSLASENLSTALGKMAPQLKAFGSWLLSAVAGAGAGILKFVFAIIISGVLLARATVGGKAAQTIAARLAGERGAEFIDLAEATVRSVTRGILGVALIQAILAGLGCLVVGVPGAGLWAFFVLLLAVVQLPTILVLGPIIIYVFYTASTFTAVVFAIWTILVSGCDSFLKPLLMGRGVDVPMLVIFIGAIGGFIFQGIIGLFIGAIILALGYKLFLAWLNEETQPAGEADEFQAPSEP